MLEKIDKKCNFEYLLMTAASTPMKALRPKNAIEARTWKRIVWKYKRLGL